MPPRLFSLAIIVSWLTMTGWLVYREVWPLFRTGDAPRYNIDLTEEVGANIVNWNIHQKDRRVGTAQSQVLRNGDRQFELRSQFRLEGLALLGRSLTVKNANVAYKVTEAGELQSFHCQFSLRTGGGALEVPLEAGLDGTVHEGFLEPKVKLLGAEVNIGTVRIPVRGNVLNPMLLLNRIPGLHDGQRWRIPLIDPMEIEGTFLVASVLPRNLRIPEVEAEVSVDGLRWDEEDVVCYKIEYKQPQNRDLQARTWVRRRDGLVLQQDLHNEFVDLVFQRAPVH